MFHFRKASIDDVQQIALIHVTSWADAYQGLMPKAYIERYTLTRRELLWRKIISKNLSEVFVAQVDCRLVGFLSFDRVQEKDLLLGQHFELSSLYVLPKYHRLGVGRGLYQTFETELLEKVKGSPTQVKLWVLDTNLIAFNFYTCLGFSETGKKLKEEVSDVCLTDLEMVKILIK